MALLHFLGNLGMASGEARHKFAPVSLAQCLGKSLVPRGSSWFIARGTGSEGLGRAGGNQGCHLCLAWCPVAISDGWKSEYVRSWSLITHPERAPLPGPGFNQPGLHVSKCLQFVLRCFRGKETQCKEPGLDGFPFLLGCYMCNFE